MRSEVDLRPTQHTSLRTPHSALRIILFDAVGTLIAPSPGVAEAYHAAGRRFGSSLAVETIRLRFRDAFNRQEVFDAQQLQPYATTETRERQRWRTIVGEVFHDVADREALFESLWEHFAQPHHWRIYDDVADCWQRLTQAGYRVGIASNFDSRLEAILNSRHTPCAVSLTGAARYISSQIGYKKPSLEFFRAIERSLQVRPEQILLVGDDLENDYLAARRAGWQALLLDRERQSPSDLTAVPTLQTLIALPEMLTASCQ
jgi:putative hydrolase of the HAD superfamily